MVLHAALPPISSWQPFRTDRSNRPGQKGDNVMGRYLQRRRLHRQARRDMLLYLEFLGGQP